MKKIRIAALTGIVLAAGIYAADAQTVVIEPQQQTVIHKYIVEHHVAPTELPQGTTVQVGSTIPDGVDLQQIDSPDVQTEYEYVVVNGQTVIVDPQTRRIVQILRD